MKIFFENYNFLGVIGIMNVKLEKIKSANNKLTRSNKNLREEKEMHEGANQKLLVETKKKEVEKNMLNNQLQASISKNFNINFFQGDQKLRTLLRDSIRENVHKESLIEELKIRSNKMQIKIETLEKTLKAGEVNFKAEVTKRFALNQVLQAMAEMFEDDHLKKKIFEFTNRLEYEDNVTKEFDLVLQQLQNVTVKHKKIKKI